MEVSGFLVLDKPLGVTSRHAVDAAARWFPRGTRLGHTGTLDPLATGVLVVAVGLGTRLTDNVQHMEKIYRTTVRFGARSDTDDGEGTIVPTQNVLAPSRLAVEQALAGFVGVIEQVPPAYSAAKVAGQRAYHLARRGADVDLAPRRVQIHAVEVRRYEYPDLDLEVRCGKGTYIRSLGRDLGERLGCGGYLQALRRTRIGPFDEGEALPLTTPAEVARQNVRELAWAAHGLPRVELGLADARRFTHGQALPCPRDAGEIAVFDETVRFMGIGRVDAEGCLRACKVFVRFD